jgi:hypothetical protein
VYSPLSLLPWLLLSRGLFESSLSWIPGDLRRKTTTGLIMSNACAGCVPWTPDAVLRRKTLRHTTCVTNSCMLNSWLA